MALNRVNTPLTYNNGYCLQWGSSKKCWSWAQETHVVLTKESVTQRKGPYASNNFRTLASAGRGSAGCIVPEKQRLSAALLLDDTSFYHIAWLALQSQIWRYQLHVIFSLVLNSWAVSNVLLLHWSILLWLHTNGDTKIVLHFWLSVVEEESTVCETIWAHGLLGVQWICVNSHFFRLFM